MAERLTEHKTTKGITRIVIKPYTIMSEEVQPIADKLCAFEDILEKYSLESVEELECFLDDYSKNQGRYFAICEEMDDLKKDRDTWKRACELACEREDDCYVYDNIHRAYEFYQQAKQVTGKLPVN